MNKELEKVLLENPVAQIDTTFLLVLCVIAIVIAYVLARMFKDKYDSKYLLVSYLLYGLIHFLVGSLWMKLPFVLVLGVYLLGGVILIYRSNKYFYEK